MNMRERTVTTSDLILIASTRVILGLGIGMLLSNKFGRDTRKGAGIALVAVGALSSIPILINLVSHNRPRFEEHERVAA